MQKLCYKSKQQENVLDGSVVLVPERPKTVGTSIFLTVKVGRLLLTEHRTALNPNQITWEPSNLL